VTRPARGAHRLTDRPLRARRSRAGGTEHSPGRR
jgi:hypothetical protein